MPISANKLIARIQRRLNDSTGVRVPAKDLVDMMNQAQLDIVVARPDIAAITTTMLLVAGVNQSLPANASALIDIPANGDGNLRPITKADLQDIDAVDFGWRKANQTNVILHFGHDLRTPRLFQVYPPALVGTKIEIQYAARPVNVPAPNAPGIEASSVFGEASIDDQWESALENMTTYYAYGSDLEGVTNANLAAMSLQRAEAILGVQLQASVTMAPTK